MIASKWQTGDIVVHAGDCLQENEDQGYAMPGGFVDTVLDPLGIDPADRTKYLPAPGNHDIDRAGWEATFGIHGDQAWYVEVNNGARWIILDSTDPNNRWKPGIDDAQQAWLSGVLSVAHDGPTYAVMHHPRKSSYDRDGSWPNGTYNDNTVLDPLYEKLYQGGVDYIFVGHSALFEVTKKIDHEWTPQADGFRQWLVSTGGWNHTGITETDTSLMNASDGSGPVTIKLLTSSEPWGSYGAALVEWTSTTSTVTYFDVNGNVRYTLSNDPVN